MDEPCYQPWSLAFLHPTSYNSPHPCHHIRLCVPLKNIQNLITETISTAAAPIPSPLCIYPVLLQKPPVRDLPVTACDLIPSFFYLFIYLFCLFPISWAAPVAYGDSQARGRIGAVLTGLRQRHSNAGSEPCLQPTPQLTAMPDP